MKNKSNSILNIKTSIIIISIIVTIYFGYEILSPIIASINTEVETVDNINTIKQFFK